MGGFLLRKAGAALVVLLLASIVVFLGVRAIPGDPAIALGAENRDPDVIAAVRHKYLLDRPLPVQYGHWLWLAVHGDLGADQRELPIAHTIVSRLPITLELAFLSMFVATIVGIPAGVIAAVRRGKPSDYAATAVAVVMRQMRSSMLNSLGADYVRTARAKGLSEWRVVGKHALRNSLITVTTVMGLQLGALISGAVITETIFGIAGFGRLTIDAVNQRDYALIQGVVLVAATGYVVVNLAVDVVYSLLNPRIRVAGAAPA